MDSPGKAAPAADLSRRRLLAGGLAVGGAAFVAGCESRAADGPAGPAGAGASGAPGTTGQPDGTASGTSSTASGKAQGDGSWQDTGPQPNQPKVEKLAAGDTPPQFVVISWDGAAEIGGMLSHFRGVAKELKASMTLFLSGIYTVPKDKRTLYKPPGRAAGSSAIPFLSAEAVHATIDNIGKAWLDGHEIGTHFNGHFCGKGGVGDWTVDQWKDEIDQALSFVSNWRTNTGFTDLPPLSFDPRKELVGGRAPCLEGSKNLRQTVDGLGWRYDTSATGLQMWPSKVGKLWALDMPSIPFVGHQGQVIAMDYNIMYNQSKTTNGDAAKRPMWQKEAVDSWMAGFKRAYDGNRAPYVIGNHFEDWNGGIYMAAVEQVMRQMATYPDTRFVSFRQLCDYVDAQDPAVLAKLRTLQIGSAPKSGWKSFLTV